MGTQTVLMDLPGLALVEEIIQSVVKAGNEVIKPVLTRILPGGKRLRPILVLAAAGFYPHDEREVSLAAAAAELIHAASLVHDDVLDSADTRRGKKTINMIWGNHVAVLTGDFLFAEAFSLLADCRPAINKLVTRTIQEMCEGEIEQLTQAWDPKTTESQYFRRIRKKTAALIAASCQIGGMTARMNDRELAALYEYGCCLGAAFQIVDDLLDYLAQKADAGKPVGNDIANGTLTLPLLHYFRQAPLPGRVWQDLLQAENTDNERLRTLLTESGSLAYAYTKAVELVNYACRCLASLPEGSSRDKLKGMALQVLARKELKDLDPAQQPAEVVETLAARSPAFQDLPAEAGEPLLLHLGIGKIEGQESLNYEVME